MQYQIVKTFLKPVIRSRQKSEKRPGRLVSARRVEIASGWEAAVGVEHYLYLINWASISLPRRGTFQTMPGPATATDPVRQVRSE